MFVGATLVSFGYCFMVIFLPSYFTYNGTTSIFFAFNYIFSTALTYLKTAGGADNERFLKLDLLVKTIVDKKSFTTDMGPRALAQQKAKLKEVMDEARAQNQRYFRTVKLASIIAYFCIFVAYIVVIAVKNPTEYKLVGLMHVILILTTDQLIYHLESDKGTFLVQDWFKCLYQFITRFICSFLLDYWLCMESISLFLTLLIVSVNLTEKLLPKPENVKADETGNSVFDSLLSTLEGGHS